ncbi:MAG: YihY/virulence factor BrkB family protein [Firmicutes bacterium]|nr:YihY/virulence factor BrkB family protein [Bacillota bacterium]
MKKRFKKFLNNFFTVLKRPEMLVLPGQLAFFFILSVVPMLTLISYGVASFNLSLEVVESFLTKSFGAEITNLLIPEVSNVSISFGFVFTILVGFFFASNGASSIIITSNTIYGIKDKGFLARKIKAMIMTVFIVLLFLFILLVPLFGESIIRIADSINSASKDGVAQVIRILNGPISWFIIFFFIKILYTMAPDKKIASNRTTYGALFTSIGWIISTAIYSFYINNYANYSIFYGSLTNIIILMLWTYLLAFIFTIGLALNYRKDELGETFEIKLSKKDIKK